MTLKHHVNLRKKNGLKIILCRHPYALAHNEVYGTNIQKGVIFMVTHDNEYQQFVVEGDEFQTFTNKWLDRVETYYKMNK